ncbi:MAG: polysaccharide biosynthesis tyrosine autokinase [Magnetococcales bacterium]|nr:polysaccharide biosynthesis tyrosine autokinase [Magnetococcales bacterium]
MGKVTSSDFGSPRHPVIDRKTPGEYLQIIRNRIWSIITLMVTSGILVIILVSSMTPIYKATATLQIEPKVSQFSSVKDIYGERAVSSEYFNTQLAVLKSRMLTHQVALYLGLDRQLPKSNPKATSKWMNYVPDLISEPLQLFLQQLNIKPQPKPNPKFAAVRTKDRLINMVKGGLMINPVRFSQLIEISYESPDPEMAAKIPNTLATVYISSGFADRKESTSKTSVWFSSRLETLRKNLQISENKLQKFLERNNRISSQSVDNVTSEDFNSVNSKMQSASYQLAEISAIYKQLQEAQKKSLEALLAIPEIMADGTVQGHRLIWSKQTLLVAKLKQRYGPLHPKMISAVTAQTVTKENLIRQVNTKIKSIKNRYELAKKNFDTLKSDQQKAKGELILSNRKNSTLSQLKSEVAANQALYNQFLARVKESAAVGDVQSDDNRVVNARLIDPADIPLYSSKPNKKRIVIISMIIVFVFGVFLAVLIDLFDNTLKSEKDVERHFQLPVLGTLPLVSIKKQRLQGSEPDWMLKGENNIHFAEAIRTLRTAILLSEVDRTNRIVAITSTLAKEGKSTVALNFAFSLSPMEKVLLIDCDLRRPSIANLLKIKKGAPGLSNVISNMSDVESCFVYLKDSQLTVLPAGDLPPNPQELLSSERFKKLIKSLSNSFDRIIIDCAPSQFISDSFLVGSIADAMIYICQLESTPIPLIKETIFRLQQSKIPITGIVLNKDTAKSKKYYYSKEYGYLGEGAT